MKERMILEKSRDIAKKYDMQSILSEIDNVHNDMQAFSLKILFVGQFSAGKTALLNTFVGKSLLEEGMRPETAIAGELVYDTDEYINAVNDNETQRFNLNESQTIDISKYNYLEWHVNNEALRKLKECTLVDMPGFNSGITDHTMLVLK